MNSYGARFGTCQFFTKLEQGPQLLDLVDKILVVRVSSPEFAPIPIPFYHPCYFQQVSQQPHAPQDSSHVSPHGDKARRPRLVPAPPPAWAADTTPLAGSEADEKPAGRRRDQARPRKESSIQVQTDTHSRGGSKRTMRTPTKAGRKRGPERCSGVGVLGERPVETCLTQWV